MTPQAKGTGTGNRRKKYSAPALEKGLDILTLLAQEPEGMSLSQISHSLDRSVGELFRMLVVLEQRGFVAPQNGSDRYALTLKMFELSHRFPPIERLTASAGPIVKDLAFKIGQTCLVVIYYQGKGNVVVQQDSPSDRVCTVRLGAEAALMATCSGHLLLTYADDAQREVMLKAIPEHHRKPKKNEVEEITTRVKARGYELIDSPNIRGVQDFGFPVFDHSGNICAALVVPFVAYVDGSHPVDLKTSLNLTRQSAHKLSELLGYSGPR